MGLDIRVKRAKKAVCPHCGKEMVGEVVANENSDGRVWYDLLEKIGYYVPYEQRTQENDWCGKDMMLTAEQTHTLYDYIGLNALYNGDAIAGLIARAVLENDYVVINADW